MATLLKKYPTYPVQIVGYTDNRGRAGEQLAFSLARAESVFSALVAARRGRQADGGQRPGRRPSRSPTTAPPPAGPRNNRIEIVFLYQ